MKTFISKNYLFYVNSRLRSLKKLFTWHHSLKSVKSLFPAFLKVGLSVNGLKTYNSIKCLGVILHSILLLIKNNGMTFAAKYLKASMLLCMKAIAGERINRSYGSCLFKETKVSLTNMGLPRIIPVFWRKEIRNNNTFVIRLVLSIFNLYRVLPFKGKVQLSTIIDSSNFKVSDRMINFIPRFLNLVGCYDNPYTFNFDPFTIRSAGSMVEVEHELRYYPSKFKGKRSTSLPYYMKPGLRSGLIRYSEYWWVTWRGNSTSGFLRSIKTLYMNPSLWGSISYFFNSSSLKRTWISKNSWFYLEEFAKIVCHFSFIFKGSLGSLVYLDEPGKVRVIAMVDVLTQWVLSPLHDYLFDILRKLNKNDGTFDQDMAVVRLKQLLKTCKCSYSYDLSAATDRLPIFLQISLLNNISPSLGDNWGNLLVNRDYLTPDGDPLRYTVGQPMGALSSWAMLAFTHHFIVQYAANLVYGNNNWFSKYVILGDDVVITDKLVAAKYLSIMKDLDVTINLSKSLVSPRGYAEFAKRFVNSSDDLSGASLLEFSSLKDGMSNLMSLTKRYKIPQSNFYRILGRGSLSQGHYYDIFRSKINSNFIDSLLYSLSIYKPYSLFYHLKEYIPYFGIPMILSNKKWVDNLFDSWKGLQSMDPILNRYGITNFMRPLSDWELISIRQLTNKWLDIILFHRVDLISRTLLINAMSGLDKYILKIFYPESKFYVDLVWGCSPKIKYTDFLSKRYSKDIILFDNPLKEKFSLLMEHPRVFFSYIARKPSDINVSHIWNRVRVLNEFKSLKGLKDLNKWVLFYLQWYSLWKNRYDILKICDVKPIPKVHNPMVPSMSFIQKMIDKRNKELYG